MGMGFWADLISRAKANAAPRVCGLLAIAAVAGPSGIAPAAAQDASEQSRLYQQMVRNPTNHDLTFEYARVATANSDYEAAIGALERLLFYNPKLTRAKYELGALYFRLGSYEMARRYFKEALASPDIDAITKERVETYLPDTEKQLQQSRDIDEVKEGIQLVFNKLRSVLQSRGLRAMESIHTEFDVEKHEAISQIPAPSPDLRGKVLDEVVRGYYLNDKIIRFAKVIVGK